MSFDPKKLNALSVRLHGRQIGVITRLAGDRHLFAFGQDYIDDSQRATVSLSFKGESGGLVTATRATGRRLPPFFSNLLPEGHLRDYLAKRAGVNPEREFFLLAILGGDLPGAIVVSPYGAAEEEFRHDAGATEAGLRHQAPLRFSLAGVQLKFSAIMEASGGLTIPADGRGGTWIVKLPSARFAAVPENEFAMLHLARSIGIETPHLELIDPGAVQGLPEDIGRIDGKALAVQRSDRGAGGERIHMEDMAQVFGLFPNDKYSGRSYANIAAMLWAEAGQEPTYDFFRRLIFSVLIGNADMHLKNWSVLYPDRRGPVMSPAYDFVSTLPYLPQEKLALSFGGSRSLNEVSVDQVRRFADTGHLPTSPLWRIVAETAEQTVEAWKTLDQAAVLPRELKSAIEKQILAVALNIHRTGALPRGGA